MKLYQWRGNLGEIPVAVPEKLFYGSQGYMGISCAKDVNLFKGSAYLNVASGFSCEISPCLSHV